MARHNVLFFSTQQSNTRLSVLSRAKLLSAQKTRTIINDGENVPCIDRYASLPRSTLEAAVITTVHPVHRRTVIVLDDRINSLGLPNNTRLVL